MFVSFLMGAFLELEKNSPVKNRVSCCPDFLPRKTGKRSEQKKKKKV